VAQPLGERSDVAGQPVRLGLGLSSKLHGGSKLARAADLGLQPCAPRPRALGEARQRVGDAFVLARDVKHIAMARRVLPGSSLPSAQALPGIGNRVVRLQSLFSSVK
jgi:hypothetical protein